MARINFNVYDHMFGRVWPQLKPAFGSFAAFGRAALSYTLSKVLEDPRNLYEVMSHASQVDSGYLLTGFNGYRVLCNLPEWDGCLENEVNGGLAAAAVTPFAFKQWLNDDRENLMRHWLAYCQQREVDSRSVWALKPCFEWPGNFDPFSCDVKTLHTLLSISARHWRYNDSFPT